MDTSRYIALVRISRWVSDFQRRNEKGKDYGHKSKKMTGLSLLFSYKEQAGWVFLDDLMADGKALSSASDWVRP